jgi:hypothetical protein
MNESLAVFILKNFTFDLKSRPEHIEVEKFVKLNELDRNLIYNLIYRLVTAQELELIILALLAENIYPVLSDDDKLED